MLFRKVVILSKTKDLAEFPGEKGLLGETKVSFVATDAHSASAFSSSTFSKKCSTKSSSIFLYAPTTEFSMAR